MHSLMYALVGEQPLPNLLPVRFLEPHTTVLVPTDRTERVSQRLRGLLPQTRLLSVDPYDIAQIEQKMQQDFDAQPQAYDQVVFNLTWGTKAMSIAAYRLAERLQMPFLYFQTEGRRSLLYRYVWNDSSQPILEHQQEIPGIISIQDYVQAHLGSYSVVGPAKNTGGAFEQAIAAALGDAVDEVVLGVKLSGALDVDLMVRIGNRVAVVEAKTGGASNSKKGIDQLNSIAGREYLGIYTAKFLVVDQRWDHTRSNLRELAEARNITLLELPSYSADQVISDDEVRQLRAAVQAKL
ncbi:DUF1887 family protein [Candidatus Viridilinea mediisalina]|uniref:Card1 CARF domain-containing protein n=1 Tax=Candidatus Viridilinea mediisalina TaxID=2024553 RepID=A0A2A6RNZ9_9CHLR|nr:DUF1887 family protein [Candidatus Viridilinea mediisalina]PDW04673.1 hypothetical protein CJ255_02535 [Candidatus Viridilinea mediisalina]